VICCVRRENVGCVLQKSIRQICIRFVMLCKIVVDDGDRGSVQIKLLCGSDVLESFAVPGLWTDEDVR